MWHFMAPLFLSPYTVSNVFQSAAPVPPLRFTESQKWGGSAGLTATRPFFPRFVLWLGGRFISEITIVLVSSVFQAGSAAAGLSPSPAASLGAGWSRNKDVD